MNLDQKTKEIQMSVAYNNAARLLAGPEGDVVTVSDAYDLLARALYAKQVSFLQEIIKPNE